MALGDRFPLSGARNGRVLAPGADGRALNGGRVGVSSTRRVPGTIPPVNSVAHFDWCGLQFRGLKELHPDAWRAQWAVA